LLEATQTMGFGLVNFGEFPRTLTFGYLILVVFLCD